jgi:hypothetical protein
MIKLKTLLKEVDWTKSLKKVNKKEYKNVTHGTTREFTKQIKKQGFKRGNRGAIYFDAKGTGGDLAFVYGSDFIFYADVSPKKIIKMDDIRKVIIPKMEELDLKINEKNINNWLYKNGFDLIDNKNEIAVLNPKIIKINKVEKIK